MPARLAARFKRDEILVPQLVDDLPRRDAALPRRADHERVTTGPGRQFGQRAAERRALGRCRRGLRKWVIDRGNHAEDVHRHIDLARNRRYVRRLEAAPIVLTVGEHDHRPSASIAIAHAARSVGDRIVQRRRSERHHRSHRLGQGLQRRGESLHLVQTGVERVNCGFVPHVEPAQKVFGRLASARQVAFHAAADVEQQRDAHAGRMRAKIGDGAGTTGIEHFEIVRREVADKASLVIANHRGDPDNIDARPERGHRMLLREQFSCQQKHQYRESRDTVDARHVAFLVQNCCHSRK